jgi:hypothetical protein
MVRVFNKPVDEKFLFLSLSFSLFLSLSLSLSLSIPVMLLALAGHCSYYNHLINTVFSSVRQTERDSLSVPSNQLLPCCLHPCIWLVSGDKGI